MHRLHNLDYLRGIAAFGIMIYHFSLWNFGAFPAESILGRVGIYGVSIFYVLSGLTLYHVYFHKMTLSFSSLKDFWIKRIFRIFPLLWLATILFVIIERKELDFYRIFLNLTGFFGFIKWDYYLAVGSWSIGNELVF
ncbi:MAG: acyltransferase [Cytophagaceae bacterium]|nr:acyltransferase [Cytophagaceae bacterium]MBK9936008.1 acyltransferase [Cytophagaceae bacterium]MBL0304106.1 acyltransferase [Cytophagaceae bacterium]